VLDECLQPAEFDEDGEEMNTLRETNQGLETSGKCSLSRYFLGLPNKATASLGARNRCSVSIPSKSSPIVMNVFGVFDSVVFGRTILALYPFVP